MNQLRSAPLRRRLCFVTPKTRPTPEKLELISLREYTWHRMRIKRMYGRD